MQHVLSAYAFAETGGESVKRCGSVLTRGFDLDWAHARLAGIKCDECCRALDATNVPIPGLFVAGADADLWAVPYFEGGSAQGFCVASGYLAGLTAAGGDIRTA